MPDKVNPYSLKRADILDHLTGDPNFFAECMTAFAIDIGASFGCDIEVSASRLLDTYDHWQGDVNRAASENFPENGIPLDEEIQPIELDHLKHAGFITFWIRRSVPIQNISKQSNPIKSVSDRMMQRFYAFSNELFAVRVGLGICLSYEARIVREEIEKSGKILTIDQRNQSLFISRRLSNWNLIRDYLHILKHKNISPHAIYLIYKTLFIDRRSA